MRILHINCNYAGTTLHQLMIEHLNAAGYSSQVFVPTYDRKLAVIRPDDNVCLCECFHKWDRLVFDYKQQKIRQALESNVRVSDFDVIHAYTLFTDGNCARILSEKYGIPYVVAVRNTDVNVFFRFMPHLRKRGVTIMREASAVFFLSESYRRQVFEKYIPKQYWNQLEKKTHIIPNGIDDFWFENMNTVQRRMNTKSIRLVYAGRVDRNKNIPTIQKAVNILRDRGYETTLTIVGKIEDNMEFPKIKSNPYTVYHPAMPKEKLIDIYRTSDIFVMPSFTETFGLVYAEAMSQGLPVIYTKGQGFDEQFSEGTVGYHVNARDFSELADCIESIAGRYSDISSSCIEHCSKFNWDAIIEEYGKIYAGICR